MSANETIGAVAVVGGGIAGVQSALDLADMGFKVYLIEKSPAIGGVMAMLDKTFPTNDCSMCILSPKLVDCARHPNIDIFTLAQVKDIKGEAGNFKVLVDQKARYIDPDVCTACGDCAEVCPIEIPDTFEQGLIMRKAIYKYYPQAIPNAYVIDKEGTSDHKGCIECGLCEKACTAGSIDHSQEDREIALDVGAVILATGSAPFDPKIKKEFGYGKFPNVITSLEFERILSASGPYEGKILRPGDKKHPKKIAWVQCVGSRDRNINQEFCSSMCCMYTTKEAVIAKEHEKDIDATVFYIDVRTFGKDFDRYVERAKREHGIKYERSRISEIYQKECGDLTIRYEDVEGELHEDTFDMVVLSIGLCMTGDRSKMLSDLGLDVNEFGFPLSGTNDPVALVKPGIFMAGSIVEPQAIPESVMQASAAASQAAALLRDSKDTLVEPAPEYPERDVSEEEPRIGVFVCNCGINIGNYVDVSKVVEYADTLDNVEYATDSLYTCSEDTQKSIVDIIKDERLNRIIVAACTPRTHEPLFKKSLSEAGLNPHLLEMANIREHCSWVHTDKDRATEKAKELISMTVAKSRLLEQIPKTTIDIEQSALVVGGGVAGMTTALSLADQGYKTVLVEKEDKLGGKLNKIKFAFEDVDLDKILAEMEKRISEHEDLELRLDSTIKEISGHVGNYNIKLSDDEEIITGAIIVTTGSSEHTPTSYGYGKDPRIVTQLELEEMLSELNEGDIEEGETFVMIQCVESREGDRNYCSRICCMGALKNALKIKDINPRAELYILYRDMMTYGFFERYYKEARENGVIFMQYDVEKKPEIKIDENITAKVWEPMLQEEIELNADHLVLSTGMNPEEGTFEVAQQLKVPLNQDGFFLEAHVKLRPVDFSTAGVFLAGSCHSPKFINECIYQAQAAAARASTVLAHPKMEAEANVAVVDDDRCSGCKTCISVCPYNAIESLTETIDGVEVTHAEITEGLCQGCGTCVAACPSGAIDQKGFKDNQILAMIKALGTCSRGVINE